LSKELLESRQHNSLDETDHVVRELQNSQIYCTFFDRYIRHEFGVHLHLVSPLNQCVVVSQRPKDLNDSENDSPVLVDVAEFVQHPQFGKRRIAPSVVRLQSLDLCTRRWGDAIHSSQAYFVTETISRFTDGERCVIDSLLTRRDAEFASKIVKCAPDVLKTITNDVRDFPREIRGDHRYSMTCRIGPDFAVSSVEVPIASEFERVIMLFGATEFETH
jgi:hypothetical protein